MRQAIVISYSREAKMEMEMEIGVLRHTNTK
jgi:hypothetical protein